MHKKMIALDLDGTLLNSESKLPLRRLKKLVLLAIKLLLQQAAPTVWHIPTTNN